MAGWISDQTPLPGALARQMVDLLLRRNPAGHIGLAAGRDAARITIPRIIEWLNARSS
jgi:hypothetical protein